MIPRKLIVALAAGLPLGACGWRIQSALAPAGTHAEIIAILSWALFIAGSLIFVGVMGLVAWAVWSRPERRDWLAHRRVILIGGIAFPMTVLMAILVSSFFISRALETEQGGTPITIEVIGERFWWRVHYPGEDGEPYVITANEIRLPVGRPVRFVLKSQDVIHSFWVPPLAGKLDMIPGMVNTYTFLAERAGIYRGQCAEYCGAQHAKMAFLAVAMLPRDFELWLTDQARPAEEPVIPFTQRGKALFLANGCGTCHRIAGTPADGLVGPDLTHVGSRLSLAAGMLPNNIGTLAGWISSAQHVKPENLMPSFGNLKGEELRAIAAYLESLK